MTKPTSFTVGVSRDFLNQEEQVAFGDIGLELLDRDPNIAWRFLEPHGSQLTAADVRGLNGLLLLGPHISARTLAGNEGRLQIIARFGVGLDSVDVEACTRNGTRVTITPDGVRRPLATAALTLLLALTHQLLHRDRLVRAGDWSGKLDHIGRGLTGRTLGLVGVGNVGAELARLAAPLEMEILGHDPYVDFAHAAAVQVQLTSLEQLLATSDVVVLLAPLTEATRGLIDAQALQLMKPTAYLINVARGPLVVIDALLAALNDRRLAGAGLDVFDPEPLPPDHPLVHHPNVILTPHSLAWSDECFRAMGRSACGGIVQVADGHEPPFVVNGAALSSSEA